MQTRSATNKALARGAVICVEKGVYTRTSPSATGEGVHIRWEYDETPESPTPVNKVRRGAAGDQTTSNATYSYTSLFDGSLSSISSSSSSDLSADFFSANSSFARLPPNGSTNAPAQSMFDAHYNVVEFRASTSGQGSTPNTLGARRRRIVPSTPKQGLIGRPRTPLGTKRPLGRTPVRRWTKNAAGLLVPEDSDDMRPTSPTPPLQQQQKRAESVDREIFDREYEKLKGRQDLIAAALANTEQEDHDMDSDAVQMRVTPCVPQAFPQAPSYAPQAVPQPMESTSNRPALGPHGTEIFDGSFRPSSARSATSSYPQQWIDRQSSGVRSFPTEFL